jgi:uncharacterized CHY-type Zn-finger protein
MYKEQAGLCKLCHKPVTEEDMHVEHNHTTLEVRGLVCGGCNHLIGYAEHPNLKAALQYIKDNS